MAHLFKPYCYRVHSLHDIKPCRALRIISCMERAPTVHAYIADVRGSVVGGHSMELVIFFLKGKPFPVGKKVVLERVYIYRPNKDTERWLC